jgi:tRNA A-37 threonylcarbamoyl transferase component Bud32
MTTPSTTDQASGRPAIVIVESPAPATARSPSDVLRVVVAAVLVLVFVFVQWIFGDSLVRFIADLLRGLDAVPTWIADAIIVSTRVLTVALLVIGLVVVLRHGRWRVLVTVGLAALLGAAAGELVARFGPSSAVVLELHQGLGPLTASTFPTVPLLAAFSAAVTASAPWLRRGWRRLGWTLVILLSVTRFLTSPIAFDTVGAVLVGWLAGALAVVVLGGPLRRPTGRAISEGLAAVGQPLERLEQASLDARGSTPYFGVGPDGRRLFVKALGADQRSADLLFRLYRRIQRRQLGDERPFSSLRRTVEHEALVALAARDVGIRTPRVVALATAEPNGFVLAYEAIEGRSLDRLEPDEVTDELLGAIWDQVGQLRHHRIAHRDLRLANVFVAAGGEAWMIDFGFSELAASDLLLANDVAELMASSSFLVGTERAVTAARAGVGGTAVQSSLDRLHPWALSGATRTELKARRGWLDDLRSRITTASP